MAGEGSGGRTLVPAGHLGRASGHPLPRSCSLAPRLPCPFSTIAVKVLLLGGSAMTPGQAQATLSLASPLLAKLESEAALMASLRHPNVVSGAGTATASRSLIPCRGQTPAAALAHYSASSFFANAGTLLL